MAPNDVGWRPGLVGKLFLGVMSLLASVVAAELLLRAVFVQEDYYFLRHRYDVNSRGMGDTEHSVAKSRGTRLLVVGDSVTFGQGILGSPQTYPRLLERQLGEGCHRSDIEVVCGARMGWDVGEIASYLDREGLRYGADIVLYAFVLNDFQVSDTARWDHPTLLGGTVDRTFRSSMLYHRLRKLKGSVLETLGRRHSYLEYLGDLCRPETNPRWDVFLAEFNRISRGVHSTGAKLVVAILPLMLSFNDEYPLRPCHATVAALAEANRDHAIDLLEDFASAGLDGHRLWVSSFDSHPNAAAHEFIAQQLARHLLRGELRADVCADARPAGEPKAADPP
jgi:hypothetical protein